MKKNRQQVFSFKTDDELAALLREMPNRSEFIRNALAAALASRCPLCRGAGILTPEQQEHWRHFLSCHTLEECEECHGVHFVCRPEGREEIQ